MWVLIFGVPEGILFDVFNTNVISYYLQHFKTILFDCCYKKLENTVFTRTAVYHLGSNVYVIIGH